MIVNEARLRELLTDMIYELATEDIRPALIRALDAVFEPTAQPSGPAATQYVRELPTHCIHGVDGRLYSCPKCEKAEPQPGATYAGVSNRNSSQNEVLDVSRADPNGVLQAATCGVCGFLHSAGTPHPQRGATPDAERPLCMDCGLLYEDLGFCDVVIPNDIWNKIAPDDGLLCFRCMSVRLSKAGFLDTPVAIRSGPYIVQELPKPAGSSARPLDRRVSQRRGLGQGCPSQMRRQGLDRRNPDSQISMRDQWRDYALVLEAAPPAASEAVWNEAIEAAIVEVEKYSHSKNRHLILHELSALKRTKERG